MDDCEAEVRMNDMAPLRQAVDQLLGGRLEPLLDLVAEDVEFEVDVSGDGPGSWSGSGAQAVVDYFTALGALPAVWQIDYGAAAGQVIVWGKERFTINGCLLEGEREFALVFDLADGRIVRLVVIEDLPSFVRGGGRLPSSDAAA
jgi:ketosteroid isomerase-like protein